jgi:hypothetical protein
MKLLVLLAILILPSSAIAQDAPKAPTAGGKSTALMKPRAAVGCAFVGTVRGTKLWAGDCTAPDQLRGGVPAAEGNAPSLRDQAAGAVPAGQK